MLNGKNHVVIRQFAAALVSILLLSASARATQTTYQFNMNGASENPTNASAATATGIASYDSVAHTLTLAATFSGITSGVTQTHFHAVTATSGLPDNNPPGETANQAAAAVTNVGIAIGNTSLPGFPVGPTVTSGTYAQVLDLTSSAIYTSAFLTANGNNTATAETSFVNALAAGKTYWNIHSNTFPGGEIRGFPNLIPEPASVALVAVAGSMPGMRLRRR